jgi:hypothetical protein
MGGASSLGIPANAAGTPPIAPADAPGLITSSPYQQPWTPTSGTVPPGGWDQRAPNPTAPVTTTTTPGLMQGTAVVPEDDFTNTWAKKPAWVESKAKAKVDDKLTLAGNLVANASATGGAYGMPAVSYGGGPAYKNAAGKYFYDKEGKYPVPAEHLRLGGGGLK